MPLKGKVAIVTGAKQGIGYEIAFSLAKKGCAVVLCSKTGCEEIAEKFRKMNLKSIGVKCDVSNKKDVEKLFEKTIKEFGKVDILVNNAGIYPFLSFEKMTEEDWNKVMDINLKGVFLCTKKATELMKENGKIINISSISSMIGFKGLVHYCASKGGVNAFTRALALELAPRKINVNAIAPGAIETPGAASPDEIKNRTILQIPLKRMGKPEDIANAVVFLASDESSYITGQVIVVDGGWVLQ